MKKIFAIVHHRIKTHMLTVKNLCMVGLLFIVVYHYLHPYVIVAHEQNIVLPYSLMIMIFNDYFAPMLLFATLLGFFTDFQFISKEDRVIRAKVGSVGFAIATILYILFISLVFILLINIFAFFIFLPKLGFYKTDHFNLDVLEILSRTKPINLQYYSGYLRRNVVFNTVYTNVVAYLITVFIAMSCFLINRITRSSFGQLFIIVVCVMDLTIENLFGVIYQYSPISYAKLSRFLEYYVIANGFNSIYICNFFTFALPTLILAIILVERFMPIPQDYIYRRKLS